MRRRTVAAVAVVAAVATVLGLSTGSTGDAAPRALPAGAAFDYQLGGDFDPAADVSVVVRDAEDGEPLERPGAYSVCYVNGFQTQPGRAGEWPADLVLTDLGDDPGWPGELLLDLSSADHRERVAEHLQPLLQACAERGFDAVELDNLDSWTRWPDVPFGQDEAVAHAALLAGRARALGLAVAQKNTPQLTREQSLDVVGFDLAISEECGAYDECAAYTGVFSDAVLDVEYTDAGFAAACTASGGSFAVTRRDVALTAPGAADHVDERC